MKKKLEKKTKLGTITKLGILKIKLGIVCH